MDKKYTKAQIVEVINELTRHHENYKNQIYKLIDALRAVCRDEGAYNMKALIYKDSNDSKILEQLQ